MGLATQAVRMVLVTLVATLLAACGHGVQPRASSAPAAQARARDIAMAFPAGFMWGVASAGHQCEGGDVTSNWAKWEADGHAKDPMGRATDFWNRYTEDFDLAKGMGMTSYRLSLEWARIEPRQGEIDPTAVQHYHDVLAAAHARGLEPIVTVSHFAYPAWLDDLDPTVDSAWESDQMPGQVARFAGWAAQEYGPQVHWWITLNEPNTLAICGYLAGMHPPGKHNPFAYRTVFAHEVEAHKECYAAIHANSPGAMVSINPIALMERTGNPVYLDHNAKHVLSAGEGGFPGPDENSFLDQVDPPWIDGHAPDPLAGKRTIDYVAFNYFYAPKLFDLYKVADYLNWPVYPEGIYLATRKLYDRHHLPIMVTENGMATDGVNPRADGWTREAYIVNHLAQLQRAAREGIPLIGYMHWAMTDNYEWGSYQPHFGLFALDHDDPALTRVRRPSADIYESIARANGLPQGLLDRYLGMKN